MSDHKQRTLDILKKVRGNLCEDEYTDAYLKEFDEAIAYVENQMYVPQYRSGGSVECTEDNPYGFPPTQ